MLPGGFNWVFDCIGSTALRPGNLGRALFQSEYLLGLPILLMLTISCGVFGVGRALFRAELVPVLPYPFGS